MEKQPKQFFEAWQDQDSVTFGPASWIAEQRSKGLLGRSAEHLYTIEANTWEEAMAVHHLRMGFEPYRPQGEPLSCTKCGALVYAQGSSQCWRCG